MKTFIIKKIEQGYCVNLKEAILTIDGKTKQEKYSLFDLGYHKNQYAFIILVINSKTGEGEYAMSAVPLHLLKISDKLDCPEEGETKMVFPMK